ncbi:MAG: tetratricopeptide repeat protein [Bacteroidia bacterium]|nr:tetratricopeptide repeat protein [Bacteroidia bacterium]
MRLLKSLLLFIFISYSLLPQNIDSIEKVLPQLKGLEKARAYYTCVYPLIFSDIQKSVRYGYYAWEIFKKQNPDSLELASLLNDLSMAYFQIANHDSSIILNKIAYGIRIRRNQWRDAGASASKIGVNYNQLHHTKEGLKWNLVAADLFRKANAKVELAKTLSNIGRAYFLNDQYEEALKIYYQGARESILLGDTLGFINVRGNIANVYEKLHNIDSAKKINQQLLETSINNGYAPYVGNFYHNLGVNESNIGNYKSALEYYLKALPLYEKFKDNDGLAGLLTNIGNMYYKLNNKKKALEFYQKGLEFSKISKSWRWLKYAHLCLAEYYSDARQHEKSMQHLKLSYMYKDSIFNEDNQRIILQMQAEYDLKEKENQLLLKDLSIRQKETEIQKRNRNIIVLLSASGILVLGIGILLLKRKAEHQKHLIQLQEKLASERSRIARDLHDNLGAELTLANTLADKYAYFAHDIKTREQWHEVAEQIRRTGLTMRDTIWAIHDNHITLKDLLHRIKDYSIRLARAKEININIENFEQIPEAMLNPEMALNLYRACQEVIQNSVKHSETNNIYLIWKNGKFTIKDNGKGFDVVMGEKSESYGLKNIKKRISDAGIAYTLESNEKGTTYELDFSRLLVFFN